MSSIRDFFFKKKGVLSSGPSVDSSMLPAGQQKQVTGAVTGNLAATSTGSAPVPLPLLDSGTAALASPSGTDLDSSNLAVKRLEGMGQPPPPSFHQTQTQLPATSSDALAEQQRKQQIADETMAGITAADLFPSHQQKQPHLPPTNGTTVAAAAVPRDMAPATMAPTTRTRTPAVPVGTGPTAAAGEKSSRPSGSSGGGNTSKVDQVRNLLKRPSSMIAPSPETHTEQAAAEASGSRLADAASAAGRSSGSAVDREQRDAKRRRDEQNNSERYEFLRDRRDKSGRRPGDPDYDPSTLFIPQHVYVTFTNFEKQYWDVKRTCMDTVLFFKKGYFYELFQEDADIGARLLGLKITVRGNMRMAGVPAKSYIPWAKQLLDAGYQVSRADEVESKVAKDKRLGSASAHSLRAASATTGDASRIMRRELAEVLSKGTVIDDALLPSADDNFVVSLLEAPGGPAAPVVLSSTAASASSRSRSLNLGSAGAPVSFGVCLCSCAVGHVFMTRLDDDESRTLLETLLVQTRPTQVIYERGNLTPATVRLLKRVLGAQVQMSGQSPTEWWSAAVALEECRRAAYFVGDLAARPRPGHAASAAQLQQMTARLTATSERTICGVTRNDELMLGALGGCVQQLRRNKIDQRVLRGATLAAYDPARSGRCVIIDGRSLANLEVLVNSVDGTKAGTLLEILDRCATPFGSRMMRRWLCHPLRLPHEIDERLDAADDAASRPAWRDTCRTALSRLPDLERLVARVCTGSGHLADVVSLLSGLRRAQDVVSDARLAGLVDASTKSDRLKRLVTERPVVLATDDDTDSSNDDDVNNHRDEDTDMGTGGGSDAGPKSGGRGLFPDLSAVLCKLEASFDVDRARTERTLVLSDGVDDEMDAATARVASVRAKLDDQLTQVRRGQYAGSSKVKFALSAQNEFAIEVPLLVNKKYPAPRDYTMVSQTKSVKRYLTPGVEALLPELVEARDQLQTARRNALVSLQHRIGRYRLEFRDAVNAIAELDCLLALNVAADTMALSGPMSRPIFVPEVADGTPGAPVATLHLDEFRHPCLAAMAASAASGGRTTSISGLLDGGGGSGEFVSNDLYLGGGSGTGTSGFCDHQAESAALITGPNMGGKSTMLRQTCVLAILAHVGCYVPARQCFLSPVDRIFTRLGAQDAIMHGQSTFMVELNEAALILEAATPRSLVIIDELGRGTSTADGSAIAGAVLRDLTDRVRCRCLFATHYHALSDEFRLDPRVKLCHMACEIVDQSVRFQYKLAPGDCPRSHGNYVARMAGVPESVIHRAEQVAQKREFAHTIGEFSSVVSTIGT